MKLKKKMEKNIERFETSKMSFLNNCHLKMCEEMAFFGNFWTFKWQLSGGSGSDRGIYNNSLEGRTLQVFPFM